MASAIRTIGHEDRLSLVDHLEELRTRLIISVAVLARRVRHLPLAEPCAAARHQQAAEGADDQTGRQRRGHSRPGGPRPAGAAQPRRQHADGAGRARQARQRPLRPRPRPARAADRRAEGRRREGAAQPRRRQSGDARHRRTVHDDDHRDAVLRADRLAAGDPVRALRLHPAGARTARAPRRDAAC